MLESKYYYAGGSCRLMFQSPTQKVKAWLDNAVEALHKGSSAAGQRSLLSINRLYGMFQQSHGRRVSAVLSQYAATQIAIACGPEAITMCMSRHRGSSNPALDGWMLEIVFFISLRNCGLDIVDSAGNKSDTWGESAVVVTDGIPALSPDSSIWTKPEKWNQGGYDAVMVCKRTHHVRLVQVTSAHKHSFRIEYFYGWLKLLSEQPDNFEVKQLEIVFVVEQEKLSTFEITTVTGEGLLTPFGWLKGTEKARVQVVGMRGLYYNLSK